MALYPALKVDVSKSIQEPIDDLKIDEWPNGGARGRSYVTGNRKRWTLVHPQVSDADYATWDAFYTANKLADDVSFASPWDSTTYTGIIFDGVPKRDHDDAGWILTVRLRQF